MKRFAFNDPRWRFPLLVAAGWPVWAWLVTRLDASDQQATALLAAAGAGLVAWRWTGEEAGEGEAAGAAAKGGADARRWQRW